MKKYLRMLKIKKEEMPLVGILVLLFTTLNTLVVRRFWFSVLSVEQRILGLVYSEVRHFGLRSYHLFRAF